MWLHHKARSRYIREARRDCSYCGQERAGFFFRKSQNYCAGKHRQVLVVSSFIFFWWLQKTNTISMNVSTFTEVNFLQEAVCIQCGNNDAESSLMRCGTCGNRAIHTFCMDPPAPPPWFCTACTQGHQRYNCNSLYLDWKASLSTQDRLQCSFSELHMQRLHSTSMASFSPRPLYKWAWNATSHFWRTSKEHPALYISATISTCICLQTTTL